MIMRRGLFSTHKFPELCTRPLRYSDPDVSVPRAHVFSKIRRRSSHRVLLGHRYSRIQSFLFLALEEGGLPPAYRIPVMERRVGTLHRLMWFPTVKLFPRAVLAGSGSSGGGLSESHYIRSGGAAYGRSSTYRS